MHNHFAHEYDVISESRLLNQWGLHPGEYITLQRGAYPTLNVKEVPKIWPVAYYEELVRLLKKCFPEKKIVQLGESKERCCEIRGVDLSLVGETDWEDLKVLLKNAWLHIDGECGMVHLRKMLHGGPSVVMFGPTSIDFYGYDGNINIASDACPHWCCKLTESAAERCLLKGEDINRCIHSIQPVHILDRIVEWAYVISLKDGGIPQRGVKSEDIEQSGICLDEDFATKILSGRYVYYHEIRQIRLSDLHIVFREKDKVVRRRLEESPAYLLLQGNTAEYSANLERDRNLCFVERHSYGKFRALQKSVNKGYDERFKIIVWPDYRIYDGHHRASILLWKYGKDYVTDVLMLYSIVLFPFHKVRRGSSVVIYGYSMIGESYFRQAVMSEYVSVVRVVDRHAERLRHTVVAQGLEIDSPECLFNGQFAYDYIVIAMGNPRNIAEVKSGLLENGVSEEKIIAHDGMIYI